jgi:hypothetical protein
VTRIAAAFYCAETVPVPVTFLITCIGFPA